jgi:TctA family transporter
MALRPAPDLLFSFFGVLVALLVRVLPGLGPVATMNLLQSYSFHVSPVSAIMLAVLILLILSMHPWVKQKREVVGEMGKGE